MKIKEQNKALIKLIDQILTTKNKEEFIKRKDKFIEKYYEIIEGVTK